MLLIGGEFPPNDDSETQVHCLVFLLSSAMVAKVAVFICNKWWKEKERVEKAYPFLTAGALSIRVHWQGPVT